MVGAIFVLAFLALGNVGAYQHHKRGGRVVVPSLFHEYYLDPLLAIVVVDAVVLAIILA